MTAADDPFPSDEEIAAWLDADADADNAAAALLRDALAPARGALPPPGLHTAVAALREQLTAGYDPYDWIRAGAGFGADLPGDDRELLVSAVAATISPPEDPGLDPDEQALLLSLERADWLGAVVELAREGPGAPARSEDLVAAVHRCPEVEIGPGFDPDDEQTEVAFALVTTAWLALGVVDRAERLTDVGAWVLPRALAQAWGSVFDPE